METSILLHCSNSILIRGVGYYISGNSKKAVQNDRSCTSGSNMKASIELNYASETSVKNEQAWMECLTLFGVGI